MRFSFVFMELRRFLFILVYRLELVRNGAAWAGYLTGLELVIIAISWLSLNWKNGYGHGSSCGDT
jgi:hypothetical protein